MSNDFGGYEFHHLDCACSDYTHSIRFVFDVEDGEIHVETHLVYWQPWYKRLINAVRYVFGIETTYGHYDTTILRRQDYDALRDMFLRSELATAALAVREQQARKP